jgi:hypothetical protein
MRDSDENQLHEREKADLRHKTKQQAQIQQTTKISPFGIVLSAMYSRHSGCSTCDDDGVPTVSLLDESFASSETDKM